ncbi:MAG TPA: mechanosensitive ion channel protein MscS [Erythrobacter sp.]|nr:mechanosensitive ion channel protein MscS [Erythrobacter sp.]
MLNEFNPAQWEIDWTIVASGAGFAAIAVAGSYVLCRIVFAVMKGLADLSETEVDELILDRVRRPVKWSFIALGLTVAAQMHDGLLQLWEPMALFLRPALLGWIAYTLVKALVAALEIKLEISDDPVAVRSRRTRIAIFSRIAIFLIIFITVGLMLLGIPGVRDIGTTLLASAGLAALAVGAAAQPALKSLIAGVQVALTEPMRIGDLVSLDGHTGRVEEIRISYVIVRKWDERAIIVPTSRFLDESFENWTRQNEMLTGPVFLHLDPITPIEPIRAEFERFVGEHGFWDKRTANALVTEAYPESIELRLAVSAKAIGELWELRCELREHMLKWLRENMPDALIRHRLEVEGANARASQE